MGSMSSVHWIVGGRVGLQPQKYHTPGRLRIEVYPADLQLHHLGNFKRRKEIYSKDRTK